jgi:uncharacterized protein (DUF1697 family)
MPTYAALLRGINLGARNRVGMAELRRLVEEAGCTDVATYVQSGNVVFRTGVRSAAKLEAELEQRIAAELRLEIPVVVRSAAELARVVKGNPFAAEESDPLRMHVTFLVESPTAAARRTLAGEDVAPDRVHVAGKDVYLHTPGGYGRAKVSNAFVERKLGVVGTARNWRTVLALAELTA